MARQTPSVNVSGILQRTGTDPTVVLYQSIGDTPIIRTDLSALAEPITNTYYQHTGETDTYTTGIMYFYNGSEYLPLTGHVFTDEIESIQDQLVYTNTTPTVNAHGGIAAGSTFNNVPIADMLTKILYPWIAPSVSASSTPNGGTFEKGNNQTVTSVKVTVTKKSARIVKVEVYDGSTLLGTKEGAELDTINTNGSGSVTFTVSVTVSSNKNLQVKVTDSDDKVTSASTGSFAFVYPYYYGVVDADVIPDATMVAGLSKLVQSKGTKSIPFTANNQKMVFATPAGNGVIKTITDPNGFNVTDTFAQSTLSVTGLDGTAQSYYVYTSNGASTVSNFTMKFAH